MEAASLGRVCRPRQLQQLQGWYSNEAMRFASPCRQSTHKTDFYSSDTDLADAFTEAKQIFEDTLCENEHDKEWITSRASVKDVIQVVADARDAYDAKHNSKAWKWLAQFSSRVKYYSSILDVMVEHHPEYAALAWGTMKLLFVVRILMPLIILPLQLTLIGCCKP